MERARAAMLAHALRVLHFHTPQSVMSMRGVPSVKDRCHVCDTWVVSRWGISDRDGTVAHALINAYVKVMTETGTHRPAPFDKPRDSVHKDVLAVVRKRFAYLAHREGILVCWACAVPVADQIHKCRDARLATEDEPSLGGDTGQASPVARPGYPSNSGVHSDTPPSTPHGTQHGNVRSRMCQKHPRTAPPRRRADLPLCPGRATGARALRTW